MGAIDRDGWKVMTDLDSVCVDIAKAIDSESWSLDEVNFKELCETINYAEDLWPTWAIKHALFLIGESNEGVLALSVFAESTKSRIPLECVYIKSVTFLSTYIS